MKEYKIVRVYQNLKNSEQQLAELRLAFDSGWQYVSSSTLPTVAVETGYDRTYVWGYIEYVLSKGEN